MDQENIARNGGNITNSNPLQCNADSEPINDTATEHAGDTKRENADRSTGERPSLDTLVRTNGNATNTAQTSVQDCQQNHASKRKRKRGPPTIAKLKKGLEVISTGASIRSAARATNLNYETLKHAWNQIRSLLPGSSEIEAYRQNKDHIYDGTLLMLLKSLNSAEKVERASLQNVAYALKTAHSVARLEQNLSTANISHLSRVDTFARIVSER